MNKVFHAASERGYADHGWLNQDAYFSLSDLDQNNSLEYKLYNKKNGVCLFVIAGKVTVADETLSKRDALGVWDFETLKFTAELDSSILLIEVPMN